MIRLHITAEGQTEQRFAQEVLAPHLAAFNIVLDARCVLTSKDKRVAKEYRGGLRSYAKAKNDIVNWLKEDKNKSCRFSTMFDLYGLPNDFPAFAEAQKESDKYKCVEILENALKEDINDARFIPYIQLHEFESLIFADPQQLDWEYLEHDLPIEKLLAQVKDKNPELINDGLTTAPSKRIIAEIPEYNKVSAGVVIAAKIGLETLRKKCRHFNEWINTLEQL